MTRLCSPVTYAHWEAPLCIFQDWDLLPGCHPERRLHAAFQLEETLLQQSGALWTVSSMLWGLPPCLKHRILTSQHLGCTGLFYSLFSGKRESSSVLPIFLAGIVTVDRGMTKARGAAQRRWPRKPLRSFPVNASWRGRAGSREQGRPQFPLSATLTLQLSQSSGRSPGLYSLGRS